MQNLNPLERAVTWLVLTVLGAGVVTFLIVLGAVLIRVLA